MRRGVAVCQGIWGVLKVVCLVEKVSVVSAEKVRIQRSFDHDRMRVRAVSGVVSGLQ